MRSKDKAYFGSLARLSTLYALGAGTSVEVNRKDALAGEQSILLSSPAGGGGSGFMLASLGVLEEQNAWSDGKWSLLPSRRTSVWSTTFLIAPNDRNFPVANLTTTKPNLPVTDLEAYMTGEKECIDLTTPPPTFFSFFFFFPFKLTP